MNIFYNAALFERSNKTVCNCVFLPVVTCLEVVHHCLTVSAFSSVPNGSNINCNRCFVLYTFECTVKVNDRVKINICKVNIIGNCDCLSCERCAALCHCRKCNKLICSLFTFDFHCCSVSIVPCVVALYHTVGNIF